MNYFTKVCTQFQRVPTLVWNLKIFCCTSLHPNGLTFKMHFGYTVKQLMWSKTRCTVYLVHANNSNRLPASSLVSTKPGSFVPLGLYYWSINQSRFVILIVILIQVPALFIFNILITILNSCSFSLPPAAIVGAACEKGGCFSVFSCTWFVRRTV